MVSWTVKWKDKISFLDTCNYAKIHSARENYSISTEVLELELFAQQAVCTDNFGQASGRWPSIKQLICGELG